MSQWTQELRHPDGAWGWGAAAAALAVVVVPQLVVQAIVPEARSAPSAAAAAGLVLHSAAVVSGIFLYLHHRLTRSDSTAWLAAGLILVGGFGLTATGLDAVTSADRPITAPLVVTDVVVLALLGMVRICERVPLTVDPAAVGFVLAFVASGVAIAISRSAGEHTLAHSATALLTLPLVVAGVVVAVEVERLATLPAWATNRFAAAIVALFLGRACLLTAGPAQVQVHLASIALTTVAAALLLGTSLATLRLAINDDRTAITVLQDQLASTTAHAEADRERLHEIRGTIAGIASASRLIHHVPPLPGPSREMLEEMLERESCRLQRLMEGTALSAPRLVPVDDVLRPLLVARRAQGQSVTSQASGLVAWAREDDLAETLNILLDNTARHAPGATVAVFAREAEGHIEVVVADSGPGVPPDCNGSLFLRGARGEDSTGQGLGLHVARRLMLRSGGYLRHDPSWKQGAAFVVGIRNVSPLPEGRRDDAARSVAQ
ncbi:sensor histidine kinase [Nocardioides pyridinolyticus]